MKTSICLLLTIVAFASVAIAQDKKDRVEIGMHTTSLTLLAPDSPFHIINTGLGGRVTYNFNRSIAAEGEINYFSQRQFIFSGNDSGAVQAQFGVKVGKRFDKVGLFAKVRPGFISVDDVSSVTPDSARVVNGIITTFTRRVERTNFFSLDAGGVLELYPARRTVVRFEAGDTAIRHPELFEFAFPGFPQPPFVRRARPAKFKHNFQFSVGVSFRLGDFPTADSDGQPVVDEPERTHRFEVGAQFTSLAVTPPTPVPQLGLIHGGPFIHKEPGVGGRFTVNLTDNIGLEAEMNFYPRNLTGRVTNLPDPSGYMTQGQFGAKIGKRTSKWGLFGKARPGFVGYTKVQELVSTRTFNVQFFNEIIPVTVGEFRIAKKFYPSIDLGGVVEFYFSRRWMARFEMGDTIIRYGEVATVGFSLRNQISRRPPETHHNLQVTSGIGVRFW